jgi:hypothetical protein
MTRDLRQYEEGGDGEERKEGEEGKRRGRNYWKELVEGISGRKEGGKGRRKDGRGREEREEGDERTEGRREGTYVYS